NLHPPPAPLLPCHSASTAERRRDGHSRIFPPLRSAIFFRPPGSRSRGRASLPPQRPLESLRIPDTKARRRRVALHRLRNRATQAASGAKTSLGWRQIPARKIQIERHEARDSPAWEKS